MKLTRREFFLAIFLFGLITNLSVIIDFQFFYIRAILSFIYLTIIPGLLIFLALKITRTDFWEDLVYVAGLSLTFIMLGGLLFNWLLPLLGIKQPLSLIPISICLQILMIIIAAIAYFRNNRLQVTIHGFRPGYLLPAGFPMLSILGAISLNNHGSNILTMVMLGGIAVYVSLLIIFRKYIPGSLYPVSVYFIALSLLLMTSLRGWYITGHDIQQEYYVFQLTKAGFHWDIALFRDTYNACLSLNILPTVYSSFLSINDLYIYKLIFQLLFPLSVVGTYLLLKKYTLRMIAFLSVFFLMSFPTFGNDMPMLNRQEISLLYFSLLLLVLFNKNLKPVMKNVLFLIFSLSMVISHYSTSYVAAALFIATYLIIFAYRKIPHHHEIIFGTRKYYLTLPMVLGTILFIFVWNSLLTKTTGGLAGVVSQTWRNIGKSFSQDLKSSDVLYSIFSWQKTDKSKLLSEYVSLQTNENKSGSPLYFDRSITQNYPISLREDILLPLTAFGKYLTGIHIEPFFFNYYFKQGSAKLVQLLLVVGTGYILFKKSFELKIADTEYGVMAVICILLLGLFILLPVFSEEYGALRFFLQTLTVLALPTVAGSFAAFSFLKYKLRIYASSAFFLLFFLSLYGFIPELTGGFYPFINLENAGFYYDAYYKHSSEITSAAWLSANSDHSFPVQSGSDSGSKILTYHGFNPIKTILPVTVQKNAYVYLNYSEVANLKDTVYFKGNSLAYQYPIQFLDDHKNLIYSNGETKIYK